MRTFHDEFVGDQAERDGLLHVEDHFLGLEIERNAAGDEGVDGEEFLREMGKVSGEFDLGEVGGGVERFVDMGDGADTAFGFFKGGEGFGVLRVSGLEAEQADNDLEIIFDAMMNLADENGLVFG